MQVASRALIWGVGIPKNLTILIVRAGEYGMTVKLAVGHLAPGSECVTIDWGDGTRESFPNISDRRHTYTKEGYYKIKISDDISSFGFSSSEDEVSRQMLVELVSLASKVTHIEGYCFNCCCNMRGVINLPNVISIGPYAFGSTGEITAFILPLITNLAQTSFYTGPTASHMYVDNLTSISSGFFEYYGNYLTDMYIRKKTCEEIKAMDGFPFKASASVRFYGSNGIVLGDGTIIHS